MAPKTIEALLSLLSRILSKLPGPGALGGSWQGLPLGSTSFAFCGVWDLEGTRQGATQSIGLSWRAVGRHRKKSEGTSIY